MFSTKCTSINAVFDDVHFYQRCLNNFHYGVITNVLVMCTYISGAFTCAPYDLRFCGGWRTRARDLRREEPPVKEQRMRVLSGAARNPKLGMPIRDRAQDPLQRCS